MPLNKNVMAEIWKLNNQLKPNDTSRFVPCGNWPSHVNIFFHIAYGFSKNCSDFNGEAQLLLVVIVNCRMFLEMEYSS